jgi:hypothetical protein
LVFEVNLIQVAWVLEDKSCQAALYSKMALKFEFHQPTSHISISLLSCRVLDAARLLPGTLTDQGKNSNAGVLDDGRTASLRWDAKGFHGLMAFLFFPLVILIFV